MRYDTLLTWCVVLAASAIAALWDIRTGRIPNLLTFPLFLLGVGFAFWKTGSTGASSAIVNAFLLSLPCFVLFLFAGGGAGDVKLLGALGSWLSFREMLFVLVSVSLAGIVCGLLSSAMHGRLRGLGTNLLRFSLGFATVLGTRRIQSAGMIVPDRPAMQPMPYGVAIGLGTWFACAVRYIWLA